MGNIITTWLDGGLILDDINNLQDARRIEVAFRGDGGYKFFGFTLYNVYYLMAFLRC